jgi:tetratricopeptide (TPR) repeat protein
VDEKDEESAARGIVEALGCHALAVDVAGAALYASSSRTPFVTFLEDLENPTDDELEFAAELAGTLPTGHEASIASTFLKSIDRLESEEGLDFLRLASRLAVAPIPATLISSVFCEVDGLDERSGRRKADLAINKAERLSLAEGVEGDEGAWSVHTLISRTMQFRDREHERSSMLRDAAVRVLTTAFRENADDPRDHAALEPVVAHAKELVDRADDIQTANLMGWVARYDYVRGAYGLAEKLQRRECETRRRVQGYEHPDTIGSMNNLAETLRRAHGDLDEAREIHEAVLETRRRVLGSEHPNTLTSMSNLATMHHAQGDLDGVLKILEEVLETTRCVFGGEHRDTLASMNNLAMTLYAQGYLERAREIQKEVLETTLRVLGEEHPSTLTSMNNFAGMLKAQGYLERAREIQKEVLETTRRVSGKEHPHTSRASWNLFTTILELGDSDSARTILENDLLWLLDRDPASLGAAQRRIREMVRQIAGQAE